MSASFTELFEKSPEFLLSGGNILNTIIPGTIINIKNDMVVVDLGLKSEGVVSLSEFKDSDGEHSIQVDDCVEVLLKSIDDGLGQTSISRIEAIRLQTIEKIKSIFEDGEHITVSIHSTSKGGLIGSYQGIDCFLPGSLIDTKPVRHFDDFIGSDLEVKIIKIDNNKNSLVVSRKAILLADSTSAAAEVFKKLKVGDLIDGEVKVLVKYGAFVDVGGVDGLIHITDLSWSRVSHPSAVVREGQIVQVKVLSFDAEKGRLGLGLKQAQGDPWDCEDLYPVGRVVSGVINSVADFGCFVSIDNSDGLSGLVHVSEMSWENAHARPQNLVSVGEAVKVVIVSRDFDKKKIGLSIKKALPNPFDEFTSKHGVGDEMVGEIKTIVAFGCFIELRKGISGLLHISKIYSGKADVANLRDDFTKGDEIVVCLDKIDMDGETIGLRLSSDDADDSNNHEETQEDKTLLDSYRNSDSKGSLGDYLKK